MTISQLDLDAGRNEEAKTKGKMPWRSMDENQMASHSVAAGRVLSEKNLHFLVRDLEDDNKYYRAIYLHERSLPALIQGIFHKFHKDSGSIAMLSFDNSAGERVVVDDDAMLQLPNGNDLVVEFQRPNLSEALVPVPVPHSSASTVVVPEYERHTQSTRFDSRDHSASTETYLGSISYNAASEVTCTTPDVQEYAQVKRSPSSRSTTEWSEPDAILNFTVAADMAETTWLDFPELSQWTPQVETPWDSSPLPTLKTSPDTVAGSEGITIPKRTGTSVKSPHTSAPGSSASPMIKLEHQLKPTPPRRSLQLAKEEKKADLLEKNRVAATKCRGKRKMAEANLQDELRDKTQENYVLQETVRQLRGQADALNMIVAQHGACMDREHCSTASNSFSAFEHDDVSTNEYSAELPSLSDDHWT